jgi:hypothetical protein
MKRIREAVEQESAAEGQRQTPTEVGSMTGDFYFRVSK